MIFHITQKNGHCVNSDCYMCPVTKCTVYCMGDVRADAKTPEAVQAIRAKEKSGAIKITREIKEQD